MKLCVHDFTRGQAYGFFLILVVSTCLAAGCQPKPDFDAYREEILALHKASIDAHLNRDVDFFTRNVAEDYVIVSRADIFYPTKEETRAQFSNYLNRTTFSEYRDLRDPIIGFSEDGSVAWSIVQVKVAGMQRKSLYFLDYKEFGGFMIPQYIERLDGHRVKGYEISGVEINPQVDNRIFSMPN